MITEAPVLHMAFSSAMGPMPLNTGAPARCAPSAILAMPPGVTRSMWDSAAVITGVRKVRPHRVMVVSGCTASRWRTSISRLSI